MLNDEKLLGIYFSPIKNPCTMLDIMETVKLHVTPFQTHVLVLSVVHVHIVRLTYALMLDRNIFIFQNDRFPDSILHYYIILVHNVYN